MQAARVTTGVRVRRARAWPSAGAETVQPSCSQGSEFERRMQWRVMKVCSVPLRKGIHRWRRGKRNVGTISGALTKLETGRTEDRYLVDYSVRPIHSSTA